jgi:Mn2+/Fe2+ NRAMP family transporter
VSDTSSPQRPLPSTIEDPPSRILGILARLGPGLIIAGSIVGSGELIGTTKTGAQAGFWLLWLIIIGCVIKVFVQVELGRDAIVRGKTTMAALSEVPGPAISGHGNWLVWYYFLMFFAGIGQLGAILGGVGQSMALSFPLTENGRAVNQRMNTETQFTVAQAELNLARSRRAADDSAANDDVVELEEQVSRLEAETKRLASAASRPAPLLTDDQLWAVIIAVITSVLLVVGRYRMVENVTTAMVATFTLMTVATVVMLEFTRSFSIGWQDVRDGLSFRIPPTPTGASTSALATALKTFGIIGVGASELISYPYWCVEKGYARFTGPKDDSPSWGSRARGWMNVMRWDAWCSMVIYTLATIAFYLLGAAVLKRVGLDPAESTMMRTLNVMYEPVFGAWSQWLFLAGAFAVLYSTYFVANAGHARVFSDALRISGVLPTSDQAKRRQVKILSGVLPLVCLAVYLLMPKTPEQLVLFSGMMQALMLPMLAGAALYFRYTRSDRRVTPGVLWDVFLWISSLGMLVAALVLAYGELAKVLK